MITALLFIGICFLAYSNGANDNFKGVATLFGSKTTNPNSTSVFSINSVSIPQIVIDNKQNCTERYAGKIFGINTQKLLDYAHFFSAGIVCFARGLNDTPKIVALLISVKVFDLNGAIISVALGMVLGGLMNARKVADTMSKKITTLNHGQGFTANLVTGLLVIFASKLGLPVSTTHVSVGSLFGISLFTKEANLKIISGIVLSWILTLPVAAILGSAIYFILNRVFL